MFSSGTKPNVNFTPSARSSIVATVAPTEPSPFLSRFRSLPALLRLDLLEDSVDAELLRDLPSSASSRPAVVSSFSRAARLEDLLLLRRRLVSSLPPSLASAFLKGSDQPQDVGLVNSI